MDDDKAKLVDALDQHIYRFVKDNLRLQLSIDPGYQYTVVEVGLYITDPETGTEQTINSATIRIQERLD